MLRAGLRRRLSLTNNGETRPPRHQKRPPRNMLSIATQHHGRGAAQTPATRGAPNTNKTQ
eukprot:8252792-Lingulodinium_polyedra.AAC.1